MLHFQIELLQLKNSFLLFSYFVFVFKTFFLKLFEFGFNYIVVKTDLLTFIG